jgi:hypothetical protein
MIFLYVFMLTTSCVSALIGEINARPTTPHSASVKRRPHNPLYTCVPLSIDLVGCRLWRRLSPTRRCLLPSTSGASRRSIKRQRLLHHGAGCGSLHHQASAACHELRATYPFPNISGNGSGEIVLFCWFCVITLVCTSLYAWLNYNIAMHSIQL